MDLYQRARDLKFQRYPGGLPVRCEHGRRWGLEMWGERCDCDRVDAVAPCKHCGRHDCQNSSTAAAARALTAEQRRADPELADRVDRARRLAGATCRRHVEASRSATLDQVVGETVAEVRAALMLPLTLAWLAGDARIADGIGRALAQVDKLDASTKRYHADHANLIAETPADVPIQLPAMPMLPDPAAAMSDALTMADYARIHAVVIKDYKPVSISKDVIDAIYRGPVASTSRPEWRTSWLARSADDRG